MRQWVGLATLLALLVAGPAAADRTQVFSIQGVDCGNAEKEIRPHLKKIKGVKKWTFDASKFEFTMTLADNVSDDVVTEVFERQGCFRAIPEAGQGAKLKAYKDEPYPKDADMVVLTSKGDAVGPLEKLRVPGKYTVLDFYADWCGPCRAIDKQLRDIVSVRKDIAVRKLNVVHFESPLAKQLGRKLRSLPYLVVFAPDGKRTEIVKSHLKELNEALGVRG